MDLKKISEWADNQVNSIRWRQKLAVPNCMIRAAPVESCCFMTAGIETVADALGIPLCGREVPSAGSSPLYRYGFFYRGIEFVQYGTEPPG